MTRDDQMQIAIGDGNMVPVKHPAIEEGFLSGDVSITIPLPETGNHPSKLQLELLPLEGNRLIGTVRAESIGDLPGFGLPLHISLSKQK